MTRYPGGFLPMPVPDRQSDEPLQRQITRQIACAIQAGAIHAGERLPSTRALAGLLGVSRNTVIAAYDELTAVGLIEGRRGAGMHVAAAAERGFGARTMRDTRLPARAVEIHDPDGTLVNINF
jgi:DNA-binding transcriptional regulator YhcF (GntR family)